MIARGAGRLIGIASLASFVGLQEVAAYTASKAAVAGLTRALAVEWARHGVTVNAIAPGVFETDLNRQILKGPRGQELLTRTPMGRFGRVEELVGAAVYLASDAATLRHRPDDRGRRRLPGQRSEPVNAGARDQRRRQRRDRARTARRRGGPFALGASTVTVAEAIPRGHKVALCAIRAGERVIKYGSPIGTCVTRYRLRRARSHAQRRERARARRPARRPAPMPPSRGAHGIAEPRNTPVSRLPSLRRPRRRAQPRAGGADGHLRRVVAERIAAAIAPIGAALPHLAGCGQLGPDLNVTHDTLAAYTRHPNVGAVIVVALGCEQVVAQYLADTARQAGRPAHIVVDPGRRRDGARDRARHRDRARARRPVGRVERAWCPASSLVLSVKCGGSDYTSGLASNPVVGRVADRLVDLGGAVVLGEIAEIMGAEHLLAERASRRRPPRSCCASSTASKPKRWRSGSTSAARSRRRATSAAA